MKRIEVTGCVKETITGYVKPECPFVAMNRSGEYHCQFGCVLAFTVLHTTAPNDCPLREGAVEISLIKSEGKKIKSASGHGAEHVS